MASAANEIWCSQQQDDSFMGGTAEHVDVWLLLEYSASWKPKANEDNTLSAAVNKWLQKSVESLSTAGMKARPQFIREAEASETDLRFIVATQTGMWCFSAKAFDDFLNLDIKAFLAEPDIRAAGMGSPGSIGSLGSLAVKELREPQYFVCMNGQRDRCCARFGRPIIERLQALDATVWHISHLGGHRFAPNVLCLPQGAVYGRLQEVEVEAFFTAVEANELYFQALRGRSWYPKIVQAAEAMAERQGLDWLGLTGDENAAQVKFSTPEDTGAENPLKIELLRKEQPTRLIASCGASAPKAVFAFERA